MRKQLDERVEHAPDPAGLQLLFESHLKHLLLRRDSLEELVEQNCTAAFRARSVVAICARYADLEAAVATLLAPVSTTLSSTVPPMRMYETKKKVMEWLGSPGGKRLRVTELDQLSPVTTCIMVKSDVRKVPKNSGLVERKRCVPSTPQMAVTMSKLRSC